MKFYETYPADGQIMLFFENARQQEEWEFFFATDLMKLYPALQFALFGRTGLQRTFGSLRHFRDIPARSDLYLASFDTYWISWYQELVERYDIAGQLRDLLPCGNAVDADMRKRFSQVLGVVHRQFDEWLPAPPPTPDLDALATRIHAAICPGLPGPLQSHLERCSAATVLEGDERPDRQVGLTEQLPVEEIKLFVERRSEIIKELDANVRRLTRLPVFMVPPVIPLPTRPDHLLAVPYNANIGMLVCREDLLQELLRPARNASKTAKRKGDLDERLFREIVAAHDRKTLNRGSSLPELRGMGSLLPVLARRKRYPGRRAGKDPRLDSQLSARPSKPAIRRAARKLAEALCSTTLIPETWEEVIALCRLANSGPYHFLIETQTFDTQLCTMLEWIWSVGGNLKVRADYSLEERPRIP